MTDHQTDNQGVRLEPILPTQAHVLDNLLGLYAYDFSEYTGDDVDENGCFRLPSFEVYWTDPTRHPLFIRVGDALAGFALIGQKSRISGDPDVWDVAEFFVLKKYRRRAVGSRAGALLFRAFPGRWEVRQRRNNQPAILFWRQLIERETRGKFVETMIEDSRWKGPVQSFEIGATSPAQASRVAAEATPEGSHGSLVGSPATHEA